MKIILLLCLLVPFLSHADARLDFKRRDPSFKSWTRVLDIEGNFEVPFVGVDLYFGKIYFVAGSPSIVKYRDEIIAEDHYSVESRKKEFYASKYQVSTINSASGLSLVEGGGAIVNVKGTNFNTASGGHLKLRVKGPGQDSMYMSFDIVLENGVFKKYLMNGSKKIEFDMIKINAKKTYLSGISILNGIRNIEFKRSGATYLTITPPP